LHTNSEKNAQEYRKADGVSTLNCPAMCIESDETVHVCHVTCGQQLASGY